MFKEQKTGLEGKWGRMDMREAEGMSGMGEACVIFLKIKLKKEYSRSS